MELTQDQQNAFQLTEQFTGNLFICGKPGVGKSVLIQYLIEHGNKEYTLAAPTGLAALNIKGKTLHSLFQIPVSKGIFAPDYNLFTKNENVINHVRYKIKHLIIDEISMVRADMLDYIDRLLRSLKENDKPFGGVQIIAVGDLYQLPPVATALDKAQLKLAHYATPFVFSAKSFVDFQVVELNQVVRQKDPVFLALLDSIRDSRTTFRDLKLLNGQLRGKASPRAIKLVSTNKEAIKINDSQLALIDQPKVTYRAEVKGKWPELPAPEFLTLKVGAQILVKANGADKNPEDKLSKGSVVNGTLGTILELTKNTAKIETSEGKQFTIYKSVAQLKIKHKVDGKWTESIVASFTQLPVQPAWAISIHKSQGQTFETVLIEPKRIFAAGQLYVALSRCKTLQGIQLASPVLERHVMSNSSVIKFYQNLKKK